MESRIYFDVYKNTLRRSDGLNPVRGENGYTKVVCRFIDDGDWNGVTAVNAGFFVNPKSIAGVNAAISKENGVRTAAFAVPSALLKQGERINFGLFSTVSSVTIATNIVTLDIVRGIVDENINYNASEAASLYEQYTGVLNDAVAIINAKDAEQDALIADKADADDVEAALATKADADDVEAALATKADADDVEAALAEKADADDVEAALATKANASSVFTKSEIGKIKGKTIYSGLTVCRNTPQTAGWSNVFLFGGITSAERTGLPALSESDSGRTFHIVLFFEECHLTGNVKFYHRKQGEASLGNEFASGLTVASGDVVSFDYTVEDGTVRDLRIRLFETAETGKQIIRVLITTDEAYTDSDKANSADVAAALATKADADDVEAALATKANASSVFTKSEIGKIKGKTIYSGLTVCRNTPQTAGWSNVFLFGGNTSAEGTGLPALSESDSGRTFHIVLFFEECHLTGKVGFYHRKQGEASFGNEFASGLTVASGDVVSFDYTVEDGTVRDLRIRLYEAAETGKQIIRVLITADEAYTDSDKANSADVAAALAQKADKATTLSGYGITDAYTKTQIDEQLNKRTSTVAKVVTLFDGTIVNKKLEAAADENCYLTGNSDSLQLDLVNGQTYKLYIKCIDVNFKPSNSIRVYHTLGSTVTQITSATQANVVSSENPIEIEYTKPSDVNSTNLRLRFNFNKGVQYISLLVTTVEYETKIVTDKLPDYCLDEIERVKTEVLNTAKYGDVVFGLYTDIHFGTPGKNATDDEQKWNGVRCMRRLADECTLDFVLQGGDLLEKNLYGNDTKILNRSQYEFSGCRAPLYTSKGDHDSNQTDTQITTPDFAKRTAPYMPKAIRSAAYPNNYYFDLPEKRTRVVNIDTGTVMAGQGGKGNDYKTWTDNQLYEWLLGYVFTENIKTGWKIIIFTHAPCDLEWQMGMAKMRKALMKAYDDSGKTPAGYSSITNDSSMMVKSSTLKLHELIQAVNSAGTFYKQAAASLKYTIAHDSKGRLDSMTNTQSDVALDNDIYYVLYNNYELSQGESRSVSFSGWTSKVRMILSGHCHCDRLNRSTLIKNGDDYERGNVNYAIAYTGSAACGGFKGTEHGDEAVGGLGKIYYNYCFGNDGSGENGAEGPDNAAWSHIKTAGETWEWSATKGEYIKVRETPAPGEVKRSYGEISEQLMDVWIVGDSYVKRVRFGAGAGNALLATSVITDENVSDNAPVPDGMYGNQMTHSWSGTTLTITSASGTSLADLKGAKGDKGEK